MKIFTLKNIMTTLFLVLSICLFATVFVAMGVEPLESLALVIGIEAVMYFVQSALPNKICLTTICGAISGDIAFSCDFPMQGGTRDRALVINYDDIDSFVYNATNKMIVEDIVLKVGKQAYQIDGRNNSIMPTFALIKQAFTDVFDHIINMKGFDISPIVKENLTGMVSGKYLIITENVFQGSLGNSAFEIYGISNGLEMTVLDRDPNNADTQGAFNFTFATNKNKEPKIPHTLFITSYGDTKTLVDALLVP